MLLNVFIRSGLRRSPKIWVASCAVAIGVIAVRALSEKHPGALRKALINSGMYRVTPGQMFGERRYRPWRLRSAGTKLEPDLADAFVALARVRITPIDRAVSDLVRGDTDRAITGFELAARVPSVAPEALTDLAAAYLLRFEKESDCIDLLRAVQAADSGLSLHPDNASLRFNRATALSLLGTRMRAAAAWQEIEQTFSDGWKEEAVAELRDLRRPSLDEEWAKVLPKIESPGSTAAEVMSLTRQFPANARLFAEEVLLPRWAAAVAAGDTPRAARSLVTATFIGAELRSHGEDLLADAVTSIGITMRDGPEEKRQALLRGLQDFGVGVVQYNEQNLISASAPLARSTDELAAADHPLRYWSRFYLAISEYYADAGRGLAVLDALLAEIPQERYPALVGRIEWIAGTSEKVQGNVETSVRRYEHAATNLRRAGGEPAAAFISVLLAESYTQLGQHSLAWEHRRLAFKHVPSSEGLRRNIAMWTEAKQALLRQGSIAVAAPLVEEAVAVADRWGRPLGRATAYLNRAEYRVEVGDRDGAWADLQQAKAAVSQMEPSGMRDQMSFLALITEGLCDRSTDPAKAAELLERGLQGQSSTRTRSGAISYTTAMADAQVAAGHPMQGAASLERVIAMFEDVRATVEDPVARMQAFRQAQPAFDQLIELRTTLLPDDREAAFRLAERSRARVLLEMTAGAPSIREDGFVRLAELERLLPPDSALVSFVVLKNRVLAWVVQNGQARQIALPIARAEIEVLIDGFRLELKRGGNAQAIREAGMPLYDALIRPLALASDGRSLIIIPDRRLARLPFAALADRESGQYLIEQRTVTIAASATLLMRRSEQRRRDPPAKASALAIGIARSGTHGGRFLPALPYAESEASHVARLYPESTLLIGKEATRENFSRMAVSSDVVHLAGHAVVDLDAPRRSVLLFASSLNDSLVPLSLDELFEAGLGKASLIVLSACRAQDSLADDREGLLGLAGAFIAAGAGEVLASPLDVSDEAVTPVMIAFHTHYRNERSAARAFREAVLELLHSGDERISSPAAWGGFTVIQGSLSDRR